MKPRKPDRFERAVSRIAKSDEDVGYTDFCFSRDVVELLRAEHAWMRRQLTSIAKIRLGSAEYQNGLNVAVLEMLRRLDQRRK